ncbi:hypothetical protein M9H77_35287 [Catharanthus roseus]|uniref:Uncharacterized protein n=1 Tax=Catharanthus roseus TaxID=4058 RepID=A0ACB9ZNK5_CATRO|nr:hypothetical protein M9H77_35287 [Catharanthus roseus]
MAVVSDLDEVDAELQAITNLEPSNDDREDEDEANNEELVSHPKVCSYRNKIIIENWDDISILFSQDRANGQCARTAMELDQVEIEPKESINLDEEEFLAKATSQIVLDEVNKVANLNDFQILNALDLLMNDQRKFETFVGLQIT